MSRLNLQQYTVSKRSCKGTTRLPFPVLCKKSILSVAKGFGQKMEFVLPVYIFEQKFMYLCSFVCLKRCDKIFFDLAPPSGQKSKMCFYEKICNKFILSYTKLSVKTLNSSVYSEKLNPGPFQWKNSKKKNF